MAEPTHVYYLHDNGSLLCHRYIPGCEADYRESDFVRAFWRFGGAKRDQVWSMLVEALAAGANKDRVFDLAGKWGCDNADAHVYAASVGAQLALDGDRWCATRMDFVNLQESPAGFGDTALEAFADLAKTLGYVAQKTWGGAFARCLSVSDPATARGGAPC